MQDLANGDQILRQGQQGSPSGRPDDSPTMLSGGSESDDEFSYTAYSKQKTAAVDYSLEATNLEEARLKIVAAQEVERYLVEIDNKMDE